MIRHLTNACQNLSNKSMDGQPAYQDRVSCYGLSSEYLTVYIRTLYRPPSNTKKIAFDGVVDSGQHSQITQQ